LTGEPLTVIKAQHLLLGANDYLTKPFTGPELLARVRRILHRAESRGELSEIARIAPCKRDNLRSAAMDELQPGSFYDLVVVGEGDNPPSAFEGLEFVERSADGLVFRSPDIEGEDRNTLVFGEDAIESAERVVFEPPADLS